MEWLRSRTALAACIWVYVLAGVALVLSPVPVTRPLGPFLHGFDTQMHDLLGVPFGAALGAVEFAANILLFIPPALLVALRLRRESWSLVVVAGITCSALIEFVQLELLPQRTASIGDVIANSVGALLGTLLSLRVRRG